MYNYEDYKFLVKVIVDHEHKDGDVCYNDYQTALEAAQSIVDSERTPYSDASVRIVLVGINYKGDGTYACQTELQLLYDYRYYGKSGRA